jgi:hypothetical protein
MTRCHARTAYDPFPLFHIDALRAIPFDHGRYAASLDLRLQRVPITGFDAAEIDSLAIDFTNAEREPDACFSNPARRPPIQLE